MIRPGWLAVLAVMFAPLPGLAQSGGMAAPQKTGEEWTVKVELDGGRSVEGSLRLDPIVIDWDFGLYQIKPAKVKMIRFSPQGDEPIIGASGVQIHGAVITTSDAEISGVVSLPTNWTIETDLGALTLDPAKLRAVTLTAKSEGPLPSRRGADAADGQGVGAFGRGSNPPRSLPFGKFIWAASPLGDRVVIKNTETGELKSLRLPASKEAPLEVVPIVSARLAALHIKGPKITRIAAFSLDDGTWHPQDLREPIKGAASPIVNNPTAAYGLGRYVYAFSSQANRWGVVELPEGASPVPVVNSDSVVVEYDGHIYTFSGKTGAWEHVDIRAMLDTPEDKETDD